MAQPLNSQQWPQLPDSVEPAVSQAIKLLYDGMINHRRAFEALREQQLAQETINNTVVQLNSAASSGGAGSGDVKGPPASTPGDIAIFADAGGKQLADSGGPPAQTLALIAKNYFQSYDKATGLFTQAQPFLTDDQDVLISGPLNSQVLTFDSSTSLWKNATPPSGFTAGGDLSGTSTSQEVIGILTKAIDATSGTIADGQFLQYQASTGKWEPVWIAKETPVLIPGSPTSGQTIMGYKVPTGRSVTYAANFANAVGQMDPTNGVNPTATVTFTVKKTISGVTSTAGTITISTSGVFTFATTGAVAFSLGGDDLLTVVNQSPADTTMAYPIFNLGGVLGGTVPTQTFSSGSVSGPGSTTVNDIVLWDSTNGTVTKDSSVQISTTLANNNTTVPTGAAVTAAIPASGLILLEQHAASTSASLEFTTPSASYNNYLLVLENIVPATGGSSLLIQMATVSGYDTTAANYATGYRFQKLVANGTGSADGGTTSVAGVFLGVADAAQPGISGNLTIHNFLSGSVYKQMEFQTSEISGSAFFTNNGGGLWKVTTAGVKFKLLFTAGNITSGTARLYGLAQ